MGGTRGQTEHTCAVVIREAEQRAAEQVQEEVLRAITGNETRQLDHGLYTATGFLIADPVALQRIIKAYLTRKRRRTGEPPATQQPLMLANISGGGRTAQSAIGPPPGLTHPDEDAASWTAGPSGGQGTSPGLANQQAAQGPVTHSGASSSGLARGFVTSQQSLAASRKKAFAEPTPEVGAGEGAEPRAAATTRTRGTAASFQCSPSCSRRAFGSGLSELGWRKLLAAHLKQQKGG